ncbi:MAG: ribosome biogenesis GTPase Der [Planctomycetaceae bacterium]|nr:ribosome biogenesis GTPase Der [Planctomycetaceae bacterium]
MSYLSVAIVGRPNVGKSTLFNALAGSRIAIEADSPGVTRDRVLYPLTIEDRTFDLVDTGGIGIVDSQKLEKQVEHQISLAIAAADLLIFLVDSRDGITPLDQEVANRLRKSGKRVLLVASKVDTQRIEDNLPSFHALGFGDALPVSAKQNRGVYDLEEAIVAALPPAPEGGDGEEDEEARLPRIAVVGRRNVGKSTFINQISGTEQVIVSDTPGTTRDSIDISIQHGDTAFVLIDTAGLRKRGQMDDSLEFFGHMRTERAIRRADAVILILDATTEIGKVDKQIAAFILENFKPCIIVLNKWDLAEEQNPGITLDAFTRYVNDKLPGLHFARLAAMSAQEGTNAWAVIESVLDLVAQGSVKVGTAQLNSALVKAQQKRATKAKGGKLGRIYYGTQTGISPPAFLLFVNNPTQFDDNYLRYLQNQLRRDLNYPEIPLKIMLKTSNEKQLGRYS